MSTQELMNEIKASVEKEVEEILRRAREESERIIEEARRKAKLIRESKVAEKKREMENKASIELALVRLDGRKRVLNVKSRMLEEVFKRVEEELKRIAERGGRRYEKALRKLILEGVLSISSRDLKISSNKRDRKIVLKLIGEVRREAEKARGGVKLEASSEDLDVIGGVIIQSADGKEIFNNTFEARLHRFRDELKGELLNILFKGA